MSVTFVVRQDVEFENRETHSQRFIFFSFGFYREELMLHQITDGTHFMQLIYGTGKTLLDCEYVREPEASTDFAREFWEEERSKNHTVRRLTGKYAAMVNFRRLKNACHKNHKKTRRRLANEYRRQHESTTAADAAVFNNDGSVSEYVCKHKANILNYYRSCTFPIRE